MSNDNKAVLLAHDTDLMILGELIGALLLTHPDPALVLSNFRQRIAALVIEGAEAGEHPADIQRLQERAAHQLEAFELLIGSSESG